MRRREFITLLGGAAAWPVATRAQQQPTRPIVGFMSSRSAADSEYLVAAFRKSQFGPGNDLLVISAQNAGFDIKFNLLDWTCLIALLAVANRFASSPSGLTGSYFANSTWTAPAALTISSGERNSASRP